jgi:hypothetical protein
VLVCYFYENDFGVFKLKIATKAEAYIGTKSD